MIDFATGGTPSASSQYNGSYAASYAFDKIATDLSRWNSDNSGYPQWIKYDLGSGNAKVLINIKVYALVDSYGTALKDYKVQGSNNNSDWTDLATIVYTSGAAYEQTDISNTTAYRYYRLYITSSYRGNILSIEEIYLYEAENESASLLETITLSDDITAQITPDSQSLSDSLSLADSIIAQITPDNQSLSDSLSLSDNWDVNTTGDSLDVNESLNLSDNFIINTFEIIKTSFNTKLYTIASVLTSYYTQLRTVFQSYKHYTTKLYTKLLTATSFKTDLRVRSTSIDSLVLGTLNDFIVKLDGIELLDVDYTTLNINLSLNTTPSTATFTLARRHDDLDKMLNGTTSIITNENKIEVFDDTTKLFTGYISEILADSANDIVKITASDCRLKMSRDSMELKYGGAWQPDSNHNGIVDEEDTTDDIAFNRPDYIKFEKNISTAFSEVMTNVGSLVSGYDSLPFDGTHVPEYIKVEKNYTELIDDLVRQTANCNWYIDENERLRFQKIGSGSIKSLPLSPLNAKRHPYDLIVDTIRLNRPSSGYAQSLIVKRGKDISEKYYIRIFSGWTYDILNSTEGPFYDYENFLNTLKEKNVFVFQEKDTGTPNSFGDEYIGMNTEAILSYSLYGGGIIWYWAYPVMKVQWVDRVLNKNLSDITVGSGLPKKTLYLNSYGKKVSNSYYSEEIKSLNPNVSYLSSHGENNTDKAYLVRITDENYDQTNFLLDLANFELSQNNKMNSSASLSLLLDAYKYYNLNFSDLINLSNTIQENIYSNNNGFPLNVESVHINCATRVVSLNLSNYGKSWYTKTVNYLLNYMPPKIEYIQEKTIFVYYSD